MAFQYNNWSDTKSGELVLPIRNEGGVIICADLNKELIKLTINDFDFAKKPSERDVRQNQQAQEVVKTEQVVEEIPIKTIIEQMEQDLPREPRITMEDINAANALKLKILRQAGLYIAGNIRDVTIDIESEKLII